jgi:hypothetical protein
MPIVMFKVSTAKSPHKGKGHEEFLKDAAERAGGKLVCLHSGGGGVAYGIVEGLHDYDAVSAFLSVVAAVAEVVSALIPD